MEPLLQTARETWRFILCSCRTEGHHARSRGRGLHQMASQLQSQSCRQSCTQSRVIRLLQIVMALTGFHQVLWLSIYSLCECGSVHIAFASQTGTTQQQALMWTCNQQAVNVQFVQSVSDLAEAVGRITNGDRFANAERYKRGTLAAIL